MMFFKKGCRLFSCVFTLVTLIFSLEVSAQGVSTVYLSAEENQFFQMINQFRQKLNLPVLEIHYSLQIAAQKHSTWMASNGVLSHYGPLADESPFQRMTLEGYTNYVIAGENVACGYGDATRTFRQFAFSPEHLENMINPHFRHFGISRAGTGQEHCPYYWTNDFGSFNDPNNDPSIITDLNLIANAIEAISGPLNGNLVKLPNHSSHNNTPANNTDSTPLFSCSIPGVIAKGSLTYFQNSDVVIALLKKDDTYQFKISYYSNGKPSISPSLLIQDVLLLKNNSLPIYTAFSTPTASTTGFMIQFNTQNGEAQFQANISNSTNAVTGNLISCTTSAASF